VVALAPVSSRHVHTRAPAPHPCEDVAAWASVSGGRTTWCGVYQVVLLDRRNGDHMVRAPYRCRDLRCPACGLEQVSGRLNWAIKAWQPYAYIWHATTTDPWAGLEALFKNRAGDWLWVTRQDPQTAQRSSELFADQPLTDILPASAWQPYAAVSGKGGPGMALDKLQAALCCPGPFPTPKASASWRQRHPHTPGMDYDPTIWEEFIFNPHREPDRQALLPTFPTRTVDDYTRQLLLTGVYYRPDWR